MSNKIPLPIELYHSNKFLLFSLAFGGAMFWLGRTVSVIADEWFIIALSMALMIFEALVILACVISFINSKPVLVIVRYRISDGHELLKRLFNKNNAIAFKDIRSLELDYHTHQDVKHWHTAILLNTGKKLHLPIRSMKYETVMINEKEIFHLINQVHQGNIPPTFEDFDMDIHDRMTTWGLFMIGFVVLILVVGHLMK
ncbi:hypothetical protein LP090_03470 [Moraxella bovis]|uniref:hypothetical protein n=1 Tax=Moraxella bovis TaxID=476 RepID=UPI002227B78A|nr:hypothetical protein [Moraxella bovis]UYZ67931.1 hypothetical protein LP122_09135 [Moraxella bovis]UYZ70305.1 hypothetical protein LP089_09235 [Moraxella bovis]UZA13605.1 hypothetical protein LP102_09295 [Moraxella bovis]UZA28040.1 hypothetical protein LP119_03470 [Moraxella bovis]UZA37418.1 hypothetical protein LP101_09580 [Moraxella bovis]